MAAMAERIPDLADVVAQNVRRRREALGLSQEQLAAQLRLIGLRWTRVTVAQFEGRSGRTKRNVTLGEALALAKALDVDVSALVKTDAEHVMNVDAPWPGAALAETAKGIYVELQIETPTWDRQLVDRGNYSSFRHSQAAH